MGKKLACLFISMLGLSLPSFAQLPTYNMGNQTVYDCQGIFMDSDLGMPAGDYDHNENLFFTICVQQANPITMTFNSFCTEFFLDVLSFYDGPDTNSPLIGRYSGSTVPPPIIANSGCLTIHFRSDDNLACEGWEAIWDVVVPAPIPPVIDSISATCTLDVVDVFFDIPVHCDSLYDSAFVLTGPDSLAIVSAVPIGCTLDSATGVRLTLDRAFNDCGDYQIDFTYGMRDVCDSLYWFTIPGNFGIYDCPIIANITATNDSVCIGDCIDVTAQAQGGDCNLNYNWSTGWPNSPGPHNFCPTVNTIITLIVSDTTGNRPDTVTYPIWVFNYPEAGPDTSRCLEDSAFTLAPADLPGGYWYGPGIADSTLGIFDPSLTGTGQFTVFYNRLGCEDSLIVTIFDAQAGPDAASCPGAAPFNLTGSTPLGGYYWGSPFVDSAGLFDPSTLGAHTVYYSFEGCTDSLIVRVDTIAFTVDDTLCQSSTFEQFSASPTGGTWSGNGIVNTNTGVFNPNAAGAGNHWVTYSINGCSDSVEIVVQGIDAGPDITACPFEAPFNLGPASPAGGLWYGNGVTDSVYGVYDPSYTAGANATDTVLYFVPASGCTDTLIVRIINTTIPDDSIRICEVDPPLALNFANTGRRPGGGTWSSASPGLTSPSGPGTFNPSLAGPGLHLLYYSVNNCSDSLYIRVEPIPTAQNDTAVCVQSPPFNLSASPLGGLWIGNGITNPNAGTFDPATAGVGTHTIAYQTIANCVDYVDVQVDSMPVISFANSADTLCYNSVNQTLIADPPGGYWTGPGVIGSDEVNTAAMGPGLHTLTYHALSGTCEDSAQFTFRILNPISYTTFQADDTICPGDTTQIAIQLSGGLGMYGYAWSHGLPNGPLQVVSPTTSTTYTVMAGDGCSDNVNASITVEVYPEVAYTLSTGPIVCYGDTNYAVGVPQNGTSNYQFEWATNPIQIGDSMFAQAGVYQVSITDLNTGCSLEDSVELEQYDYINAYFNKNPNRPCVTTKYSTIQMIDYSIGGTSGLWTFGDGMDTSYNYGENVSHFYPDTGTYIIELYIENDGGCSSTWRDTLCVEAEPVLDIPNAFSPNDDGINDIFEFRILGVYTFEFMVYDRWGKQLFYSNDTKATWDGKINGNTIPTGIYPYLIKYLHPYSGEEIKQRGSITVYY